ncbi:MAG: type II toxin-antitoxin system mRNA interferase toxin, RelE/StbE family [Candidatus Paceibacterota bacterium]|jgi:addiction module RelE/StbE family toxin
MNILFHRHFGKSYKKFPKKVQEQFKERLKAFTDDPFDPILGNHALHGEYAGFRSINVTGDIRAIYKVLNESSIEFALLDSHSNLYS